jgi:hypothetical protein
MKTYAMWVYQVGVMLRSHGNLNGPATNLPHLGLRPAINKANAKERAKTARRSKPIVRGLFELALMIGAVVLFVSAMSGINALQTSLLLRP